MEYLSEQLMTELGLDKSKLCDQKKIQKIIRGYFIKVHESAVDATIIAKNKKNFSRPNFYDK